jgi:hypothetical protein
MSRWSRLRPLLGTRVRSDRRALHARWREGLSEVEAGGDEQVLSATELAQRDYEPHYREQGAL